MSDKITLFGRSHSCVGSTNSDFIIRTRGLVQIQVGKVFLDLIKDGKLNNGSSSLEIYNVDSEDEVGSKGNGFYLVGDKLYLYVDGNKFLLGSKEGGLYVSYEEQKPTVEQQEQAQKNIGILVDNKEDIPPGYNGIVFVKNDNKIYQVTGGTTSEIVVNTQIPNPYPNQFVIQKNDGEVGALKLVGQGAENGINFNDQVKVYYDNNFVVDSIADIILKNNGQDKVTISPNQVTVTTDAQFDDTVTSNKFQSKGATANSGFRLYEQNGESTLEVDNLVVRNQTGNKLTYKQLLYAIQSETLEVGQEYIIIDFQNKWQLDLYGDLVTGDETEDDQETNTTRNTRWLKVTASSSNTISQNVVDLDHPDWKIKYALQADQYTYNADYTNEEYTIGDADWCEYAFTYNGDPICKDKTDDNATTYEPKGEIIYLEDEKGNSMPYDFKNLQYYVQYLDGTQKWMYTFDDGNGKESSSNFSKTTVLGFNYKMQSKKYQDAGGSYWDNLNKGQYHLVFVGNGYNNHFASISQDLIIHPSVFEGNTFNGSFKNITFGQIRDKKPEDPTLGLYRNIAYGDIDTVKIVGGMYDCSIEYLNNVSILDGDYNGKYYRGISSVKFHGQLANIDFNPKDHFKLYDPTKVCDVYKQNYINSQGTVDQPLRIVCIPDYASKNDWGLVKVGTGIDVTEDGVISTTNTGGGGTQQPYELPVATKTTLGGVKVGNNLTITEDGTLSATGSTSGGGGSYTLPPATKTTLGGVIVGYGLSVTEDGTIQLEQPSYNTKDLGNRFSIPIDNSVELYTVSLNDSGRIELYTDEEYPEHIFYVKIQNTASYPIDIEGQSYYGLIESIIDPYQSAMFKYTPFTQGTLCEMISPALLPQTYVGTSSTPIILFSGIVKNSTSNSQDKVSIHSYLNYAKYQNVGTSLTIQFNSRYFRASAHFTSVTAMISDNHDNNIYDSYNRSGRGINSQWLMAGVDKNGYNIVIKAQGQDDSNNDAFTRAMDRVYEMNITVYGYISIS